MNRIRTRRPRRVLAAAAIVALGSAGDRRRRLGRRPGEGRRDAHDRSRRGSGRTRPDTRADLRRADGLPAHVREALRPEREARDRPAARRRAADALAGQEVADDQDPPRRPLQRRHAAERRGGEDLARPTPHADGSARASEVSPVDRRRGWSTTTTVRLPLNARYSPLTAQLADRAGMIMSPKQLDALGTNFASNPVCVGPFKFTSRTAGDRIVLDKSQFYYGRAKVKLNRIVFRIITDTSARAANLRSHDINVARPDRVDRPARDPARQEPPRPEGDVDRLPGPLDQHREQERDREAVRERRHPARVAAVRSAQAFELSLDRKVINNVVFGGRCCRAACRSRRSSPYFDPTIKCPPRQQPRQGPSSSSRHRDVHAGPSQPDDRHRPGRRAARPGDPVDGQGRRLPGRPRADGVRHGPAPAGRRATTRRSRSAGRAGSTRTATSTSSSTTKGSLNNLGWSSPQMDLLLDNARKAADGQGAEDPLPRGVQDPQRRICR